MGYYADEIGYGGKVEGWRGYRDRVTGLEEIREGIYFLSA